MKSGKKKQLLGTDILLLAIYLYGYLNISYEYKPIYAILGLVGLVFILIGFFSKD